MDRYFVYYSCFNGDYTWYEIMPFDTKEELDAFIKKVDSSISYNIIKVIYGQEINPYEVL